MLKNYEIELEVMTPVFIGSGEEISKKDCLYLNNERMIYVLDSMKVFEGLRKIHMLDRYEEFLMDAKQRNFSMFTRDINIPLNTVKSWAAYTLPMNDITDVMNNSRKQGGGSDNIAAFIKDKYGCTFIPGSSLKGAIRTVIQNALCRHGDFSAERRNIETESFEKRTRYLSAAEKNISRTLFNKLKRTEKPGDMLNDIFAGLRISDSRPLDISSLILCQKTDVKPDGTYASLPIKRECLKPGTKAIFSLEIDTGLFDISAGSICEYARAVFDDYRSDFLDRFKSGEIKPVNCETPLVLGGGSGYASKTSVYSLYEDRASAVRTIQKIMIDTTSTRKQRDPHRHSDDSRMHKVSPHIRKCTVYNGRMYDMGICDMHIKEL